MELGRRWWWLRYCLQLSRWGMLCSIILMPLYQNYLEYIFFDFRINKWIFTFILTRRNFENNLDKFMGLKCFLKLTGGTEDTQLDVRPCFGHVQGKKYNPNVQPSHSLLVILWHMPIPVICPGYVWNISNLAGQQRQNCYLHRNIEKEYSLDDQLIDHWYAWFWTRKSS